MCVFGFKPQYAFLLLVEYLALAQISTSWKSVKNCLEKGQKENEDPVDT